MTNLLKIELTIASLIGVVLLVLWLLQLLEKIRLKKVYNSLAVEPSHEVFTEEVIADLPAPAQRYFRHAIQIGTPLASSVHLDINGKVQYGTKSKYWPMKAKNVVITPRQGFVWPETTNIGPIIFNGFLYYIHEYGKVHWTFFNLIPDTAKSGEDEDTAKSMLGRLISKYAWTPFALLPQQGAVWEAIDDEHAKVTVVVDGTPVTLTLTIDSEGKLRELVFLRWGAKSKDKSFAYFPYGITVDEEKTFHGYTIPSRLSATWCYGDVNQESPLIFHYVIEQASFS